MDGWDFGNNNNNVNASNFHGTHVAGIVVGVGGNGKGIAGLAGGLGTPGARAMIVAVGDSGPVGSVIDDSILYAIDNGARLITLSLAVGQTSAIDDALDEAYFVHDLFIDCAAGNNGSSVTYPANQPQVMAIASTTHSDQKSSFSNPGPDLEVSAPGSDILSTQLGNSYGLSSGTSFAAPYVGALAALIRGYNPDWSFDLSDEDAAELIAKAPEGGVWALHSPPQGPLRRQRQRRPPRQRRDRRGDRGEGAGGRGLRPHPRVLGRRERDRRDPGLQPRPARPRDRRLVFASMADVDPRERDEWRVEVELDADEHGHSLGERLRALNLDNEAEKRLGGSVIVTRDGPHLFLYAWHEESAQEAERVIRELMEEDGLSGEVSLMRWHPVEEAWKPASEPLPETEDEVEAERRRNERAEEIEAAERATTTGRS